MREPDHSPDEEEALRRYLRPLKPDPVKELAKQLRRERGRPPRAPTIHGDRKKPRV